MTQVLQDMLEFNPHFRKTPKQLLSLAMFDKCREQYKGLDSEAPIVISLEIDKAGTFDYDKCQLDTVPLEDIYEALEKEVQIIKSMNLI